MAARQEKVNPLCQKQSDNFDEILKAKALLGKYLI